MIVRVIVDIDAQSFSEYSEFAGKRVTPAAVVRDVRNAVEGALRELEPDMGDAVRAVVMNVTAKNAGGEL